MPEPLSQTQTRQVREEIARQIDEQITPIRKRQRKLAIWLVVLLVGAIIGATVGVYFYAQSIQYARSTSCKRAQAFSVGLALVVHSAIPPNSAPEAKHRTAEQRAFVQLFYKKIAPALKVPSCS